MQIAAFGFIVVLLGVWCQFCRFTVTLQVMLGLCVFGAASALDLPALGGASVTPANMFLLFYLLRAISMRHGAATLLSEFSPRQPLFPFALLIIWILGSALLLPRLFDGATQVFSLSRSLDNDGMSPLHATGGNLSQCVYALGGFLIAGVTSAFARKPGGMSAVVSGIILVTSLHFLFAALDLATAATHSGYLLDFIHTGGYAFLTGDELGGLKRLSGTFSEASSFATFSLTLLGVNFALFVMRVRPGFTGPASAVLVVAIALSTSSAGYAGLAVFTAAFLGYALFAGLFWHRKRVLTTAAITICIGSLVVGLVILFFPAVGDVAGKVVTESLLDKGASDSAVERSAWNAQAWQVFLDTYGMGAGIGATRASNYALVLLSNLGIFGFALFVFLVIRVTLSWPSTMVGDEDRRISYAARIGIVTTLVPYLLVGTVYDLGTLFYCLVGVAAAGIGQRVAISSQSTPQMFWQKSVPSQSF